MRIQKVKSGGINYNLITNTDMKISPEKRIPSENNEGYDFFLKHKKEYAGLYLISSKRELTPEEQERFEYLLDKITLGISDKSVPAHGV